MAVLDYFKSVPSMTAEEVRRFIAEKHPGQYNLVDVRQPGEYAADHIPGARLIPMAELQERLQELDPKKPTIAY